MKFSNSFRMFQFDSWSTKYLGTVHQSLHWPHEVNGGCRPRRSLLSCDFEVDESLYFTQIWIDIVRFHVFSTFFLVGETLWILFCCRNAAKRLKMTGCLCWNDPTEVVLWNRDCGLNFCYVLPKKLPIKKTFQVTFLLCGNQTSPFLLIFFITL